MNRKHLKSYSYFSFRNNGEVFWKEVSTVVDVMAYKWFLLRGADSGLRHQLHGPSSRFVSYAK